MGIISRSGDENGLWSWKDEHTRLWYFKYTKLPYVQADKHMITLHLFRRAFQFIYWSK